MKLLDAFMAIVLMASSVAMGKAADDIAMLEGLRADVLALAGDIGPRSVYQGESLANAAKYISAELTRAGWVVKADTYDVGNVACANLVVEKLGATKPGEFVVVGAHYDTVPVTPGADDNASGVAVLLALARELSGARPERTLRLVAFANEEPIYFQTEFMGSRVYARGCKERREQVIAMLSLECLGFYTDGTNTQKYPFPLSAIYPSRGNFVAVVGNRASKALVKQVGRSIRGSRTVACESIAMPDLLPGIGWSDHWSFWQEGYPAAMLTDTALNRNPHYHRASDLPATLNYEKMAAATRGILAAVQDLLK